MTDLEEKLAGLGITPAMRTACRVPACEEAGDLVDAGRDMFDRPQRMTPDTFKAWQAMQQAAASEGIELKLVSAYRSVEYQCEVIQRKLDSGRQIEEILRSNAIPGHSEHHTGCALDLHTGDDEPLTESFETTTAFAWLTEHAERFGFYLSFPRNNPAGIDYEPWHWCFKKKKTWRPDMEVN